MHIERFRYSFAFSSTNSREILINFMNQCGKILTIGASHSVLLISFLIYEDVDYLILYRWSLSKINKVSFCTLMKEINFSF